MSSTTSTTTTTKTTNTTVGPHGSLIVTEKRVTTDTDTTTTRIPSPTDSAAWVLNPDGTLTFTMPSGDVLLIGLANSNPGNVYPISMPGGIANGAPISVGAGPDILQFNLGNNPNSPGAETQYSVLVDDTLALNGFVLSSFGGADVSQGQVATLRHSFGGGPHQITFQGSGTGLTDLFFGYVTNNGTAYETSGQQQIYNGNRVQTIPWAPFKAPPPPPPLSIISGANINGQPVIPGTLQALVTQAATATAPITLALPAGTFIGTARVPVVMTISGAGAGKTIITAQGLEPAEDKAVFVPDVGGVVLSGMTIQDAQIPASLGQNAAGVRDGGPGMGVVLTNIESTGNQNGVLTSGGSWLCTNLWSHDNVGGTPGLTHAFYAQPDDPANDTITLVSSTLDATGGTTHAFKSRAVENIINGGTLISGGNPDGNVSGSIVDLPIGGNTSVSGTLFLLKAGSANRAFVTAGGESETPNPGTLIKFTGCSFVDQTGLGGFFNAGPDITNLTLDVTGSTWSGAVAPQQSGWASVIGWPMAQTSSSAAVPA